MTATAWRHARVDRLGYEVSSVGDVRFSPLYALLPDGRTVEEAYQLDVKGYRARGDDWRLGKGKRPLCRMTEEQLYAAFLALWREWASHCRSELEELRDLASEHMLLTDTFASTPINQARALADLLSDPLEEAYRG